MTDVKFGPSGHEWHYNRGTKTYDLSHGSSSKLTLSTTAGPVNTSVIVNPKTTALVVVDMQNFFLDVKCMDHPNGLAAVEPTITVLEKCQELGIRTIWLNWGLTDEDLATMPSAVQRGFMKDIIQNTSGPRRPYTGLGSDLGSGMGRCLFAGTWNADIYPALKAHVQPADLHCAKNRMSGLWTPEQPLWKTLKETGVETVLWAGVNTDQCVLGTLVDAYNAGWNCVLVEDCVGTTTVGGKETSFYNVATSYGFIVDSKSVVGGKVG